MMPPRLMRLEERIVLDAAGPADDGSDSDSSDGGDSQFAGTCSGSAHNTNHGTAPSEHNATANYADPAVDNAADSLAPSDRSGAPPESAIERAIRPSFEPTGDPTPLQGFLGEWHDQVVDGLRDLGDAVEQFFSALSHTLQQTFANGLAAILGQHAGSAAQSTQQLGQDGDDAPLQTDADQDCDHDDSSEASPSVLVVSSSVDQAEVLAAAASDDVISTIFDGSNMTPDSLLLQIRDVLGDQQAHSIALATNGLGDGFFELTGGVLVNLDSLQDSEMQAFWIGLADMVEPGGRIDLLACDAAAGAQGRELLAALEELTGVDFAASADKTGDAGRGGDWILESDDVDAAAVYFDGDDPAGYAAVLGDLMPTITDTNPGNTAVGGGGAVVVDAGITVNDGDGGTDDLQGAVVRITTGFVSAEDQLSFTAGSGISGSYDAATGELILSGVATAAEYQQVLRSVTYENTNATPDTTARTMLFVIGDDFDGYSYYAVNGHYYQFVDTPTNWLGADAAADASTLGGLQGYLATVTSAGENTVITGMVPGSRQPWLGASDSAVEGEWRWVNGPETGTQFSDAVGASVGGMYENRDAGEPDHAAGPSYIRIDDTGVWIDWQENASQR